MATSKTTQSASRYYVTHQGQVRGPFDLRMIEAMALAGQFPANVPVCRVGTEEWIPLGSPLIQPPPLPNREAARPKKNYGWDSPAKISLIVVGSVVALIIGGNAINDLGKPSRTNSYSSPKTAYTPPASSYTQPKTTYSSPSYTPPKSTYSSPNMSSDSTLYRDAQGRTYRVPNSAYQRLLVKKTELDAKQRSINLAQAELDSLSAEFDRLKRTIDRTSQYQIDSFNDKVNAYNTKNNQLQIQIDSFNAAVDAFNAELERVGTPIR
jgi:hypothetical protein